MKNLRKTRPFRYINAFVFIIVFQFFTANAGFTNPNRQRLSIEPYAGSLYMAYLNGIPLGLLNKDKILESLKGLDYNNFSRMRDLLNIKKAHLDIYSIFQTILLGYLISQTDPVHYAGTLELIYIYGRSLLTVRHLVKDLGEEDINMAISLSSATAVSPFLGMFIEGLSRDLNFKRMLDVKDTRISHRQFEIYTKLIKKYVAEAI
jgi:hypothetical protein